MPNGNNGNKGNIMGIKGIMSEVDYRERGEGCKHRARVETSLRRLRTL